VGTFRKFLLITTSRRLGGKCHDIVYPELKIMCQDIVNPD